MNRFGKHKVFVGLFRSLNSINARVIFATAFYAQKKYRFPTFVSVGAVFLNVALNALFV